MNEVTGVILAGGKSKRMGVNKALLDINGRKNIERIKLQLSQVTKKMIVITNTPSVYDFLNLPLVEDAFKDKGPLAGIHSGLMASTTEWNLFIACDLPFFTPEIANFYIELLKNDDRTKEADAIVPYIQGRKNPLVAMYNKRIVPIVESNLKNDKLVIATVLDELNVVKVTEKDFLDAGMSIEEINDAFFNMNRPEDYDYVLNKLETSDYLEG